MLKKIRRYALIAIILLLFLWSAGLCFFGVKINSYNVDFTTKTDAVIVLTGGRNRIIEGIKIINAHLADRLFISGVSADVTLDDIEKSHNIKITNPEMVELGYNAANTIENASEISDWIENNDIESVRLITSNYHIPRSIEELSVYPLNATVLIHPVYSEKVSAQWWKTKGTRKLIISEYNKFLYAYVRNCLNLWKRK